MFINLSKYFNKNLFFESCQGKMITELFRLHRLHRLHKHYSFQQFH